MKWGVFFGFLFFLLVVILLSFYWFVPYGKIEFTFQPKNSNFSILETSKNMQFYPNMRYPDSSISYKITNCPLQKKNDMEYAFEILESKTILKFYPVDSNEEISVACDYKQEYEGGLFIAGEGGPTNITGSGDFNIILNGEVLLLKESDCPQPNIAIHELLHALGFDHSTNKNNIMYNISICDQTIGEDTIDYINKLYSYPSYPDLTFENVSAIMHGKYLDLNLTVKNNGLLKSGKTTVSVLADNKEIKTIDIDELNPGYGMIITITNLWVPKLEISELNLTINSEFQELDKENNKISLKIKS